MKEQQYKKLLHRQRLMAAILVLCGLIGALLDHGDLTVLLFFAPMYVPMGLSKRIYIYSEEELVRHDENR